MRRRVSALLAAGLFALAGAAGCGESEAEREVNQGKEAAGEAADDAGNAAEDAGKKLEQETEK